MNAGERIETAKTLSADDRQFIDEIAAFLMPWGMAPATARLYGYLLLSPVAVTLDQIAADLGISKSSASVAARLLERSLLARRSGERGSKRIFYEASDTCGNVLRERCEMLGAVAGVMERRAAKPASAVARERLVTIAGFYLLMRDAVATAVQKVIDASAER